MKYLSWLNNSQENLKGFWEEVEQSAPKTWLMASLIGVIAVSMSLPADIQTFQGPNLHLAFILRAVMFFYFFFNLLIAYRYPVFTRQHYQTLMTLILYVVGIPVAMMSFLGGEKAILYFMGIIEVEFAAATFFTIPKKNFIAGVVTINFFYIALHSVFKNWTDVSHFTDISISLLIFAFLAIYAQHTILEFKIKNYLKHHELQKSRREISIILTRITDAFLALDNSWRFTYFNRAAEFLLSRMKRSKEDLLGKNLWEEFPGLLDSTMRTQFLQSEEKNIPVTFEEYYPLMNAYMEVHAYPSTEGMSVYFHDITARKLAEVSLRKSHEELEIRVTERTEELQELSTYTDILREEEWKRISREIHDELGQTLTGLKITISCLKDHLGEMDEFTKGKLKNMSDSVTEMIEGVRRIAAELRPVVIDDLGLAAAVEWYVNTMRERGGSLLDYTIEPDEIDLDPDRSIAIYRILQEALNNAARHSHATRIEVLLRQTEEEVILEVRDNGIGLPRNPENHRRTGGLGILGMKERVRRFEGSFLLSGQPGGGTTLRIALPYRLQPNGRFS
jgi:signal transduction histidine kinase